jgi:hypothetical protein
LLDRPACFFRGNEPPFVRSPHPLLNDAAGFGIDLGLGLIANKRIDTPQHTHACNPHEKPDGEPPLSGRCAPNDETGRLLPHYDNGK